MKGIGVCSPAHYEAEYLTIIGHKHPSFLGMLAPYTPSTTHHYIPHPV